MFEDIDRTELDLLADSKIEEIMEAGYSEKEARQHANIWASHAQVFAPLWNEKPEDFLSRITVTTEQSYNGESIARYKVDKRNIYGQPINNDVDLDAPVEVVTIEPRFTGQNAKVLRKRFPSKIKEQVLSVFENGIVNEDTGKSFHLSANDFKEHVKFEDTDIVDGLLQLEAIAALPELARTAKLVESYADKKNVPEIKKMHRFQGALRIGDKDYSVKLTIKEYHNGILEIDTENPFKLYHHRIEKELSTGNFLNSSQMTPLRPSVNSSNMYTLRSLIEDVKDSEGNKFFQTEETPLVRQGITRKPDSDNTLYQTQQINLSIDNVRSQYEGTKQWMKAPNGKDTKLTEKQWLQVRTPEFKAWFGDWENDPANASKVVDENGEPLVVYHGTKATIENDFIFNHDFIGQNGSAEGYGFYFTTDKSTAEGYTNSDNASSSLIESYLNIRKPMPFKQKAFSKSVLKKILKRAVELEIQENPEEIADYKDSFISNYADTYSSSFDSVLSEASDIILDSSDTAIDQMVEIANVSGSKKNISQAVKDVTGYDAVMANGYADLGVNGGKIYVAWFSNEIKSVDNTGSFNANDPRILYQLAYHGSPHKFDNFTLDAIGSGEGAQAHGWGLYFAKNKKTSEEYRKKLVFGYDYFLTTEDGKPISEDDKEYILKTVKPENLLKNKQDNINELLENSQSKWIKGKTISAEPNIKRYEEVQKIVADNSSLTVTDLKKRMPKELLSDFTYFVDIVRNEKKSKRVSALEILDEIPRQIEAWREREIKDIQERQENIDRLEHLKKQNIHFEAKEKQGQLFEVDIPENNVLLDEQKTFYKQPAKVKKALEKLYADNGKDIHEGMTPFYQPTGEEIYSNIKHYFANNSAEKASKLLNEYGIKGITYDGKLDGRCFVVFDDKAISVLETYYQKQNEAKLAEERLQEDLQAWDKTVEKFLNKGLNPRKPVIMLKNTPLVLTLLGADKNLTVSTNYSTLNKVLREKHKLPADIMKQVPQAMTDPIMIFKSATVANDYVMMLDLKDENGASIVVPVSLNYDGIANYTVNYVPSVYPQKNTETNKPKNMWFINQIENGNLVYYNKEKSREWRTSSGLQLPRVGSDLITHGRNKHILTDADLSRVKNANPEYYHAPSPRGLIRFDPKTQQAVITVFQDKKNLSTLLHETGHFFLQNLAEAYKMENAPLIVG